jgi:integrase
MQLRAVYDELKSLGKVQTSQTVEHHMAVICQYFYGVEIPEITYGRTLEFIQYVRTVSPKGQALKNSTINRVLSQLSLLLTNYQKHDRDYRKPELPWLDEEKHRQETLTSDDDRAILSHLNEVDAIVFRVLNKAGCRIGELLRETPDKKKKLRLEHIEEDGFITFHDTKNGDDRTVYIGEELAGLLRSHFSNLPPYSTFRHHLRKAAKKAKVTIPYRMIHGIRHKVACKTASLDVPIDQSMKMLGHRSFTTHQKYRKLSKEVQRRSAREIALLMGE